MSGEKVPDGVNHCHTQNRKGLGDATQCPGKSTIFSPLKIGGGRGVNPDSGKIETKDSNFSDRASVSWENLD